MRIYGVRGPGVGDGSVSTDGERPSEISFFAPAKVARVLVYSSPLLRLDSHIITVSAPATTHERGRQISYINISGAAYE